jgi:spore cortex formation protein SpoVR/YcgB (stage V sporulation)
MQPSNRVIRLHAAKNNTDTFNNNALFRRIIDALTYSREETTLENCIDVIAELCKKIENMQAKEVERILRGLPND